MPTKNIPLLKRLRTRFLRVRHKEHFDIYPIARKTEYGAAMCFIGHTLVLEGWKMRLLPEDKRTGILDYTFVAPDGSVPNDVGAAARRLLGLTLFEANALFYDWTIETPKQGAERIEALISDNV